MYDTVLFDLDGTLTDSSEGITRCVQKALHHFGIDDYSKDDLRVFIGPPLLETFPKFGVPEDRVEEAIAVFRSRYLTKGKFENRPFDGVIAMLEKLQKSGVRLFVATSKPEETAIEILRHFHMDTYFEKICGASFDHSRENKDQIIAYVRQYVNEARMLMVGDTIYDIRGAKKQNIPSVGVSWGFGDRQEMLDGGALAVVSTVDELIDFILE